MSIRVMGGCTQSQEDLRKVLIPLFLLLHNLCNNTGNRMDKSLCTPITLRVVWHCPLSDKLNQAA